MGIFGSILKKLGFGEDEKNETTVNSLPDTNATAPSESGETNDLPVSEPSENPTQENKTVDVEAKLEELAAANPQKLNWRESIVDLMKLLGLDSSYAHRKELARELGCPEELMADSAKMNVWLHRTVMTKLAENGGKVPTDLLA
ncbi:DUF3597 domain-containing protein [Hydrogenimonas sp. SS33]|uniref:DUF3597 domain-containing protein n=1 Tax=Hydrogenimonas leucolamina TaxID=2954236 RepID=UPI00336C2368